MERALEAANMIANRQVIPRRYSGSKRLSEPGGLRIGTSEITRLAEKNVFGVL